MFGKGMGFNAVKVFAVKIKESDSSKCYNSQLRLL